ncbi:MAG TPA: hypothetical protein VMI32_10350 [Candidatus Solibacter sp.]|nr:hypothetical protein [Candidatus Solibacter sp.]
MSRGAVFLLVLGLMQMTGDLLKLPALKAVAAATGASPAPKVFSTVQGLETFSSQFRIEWQDRNGKTNTLELTPEIYAQVRGPYNRRNVFGAALAYAPVLAKDPRTRSMYDSVVGYALCGEAPLLRELGIDPAKISSPAQIRLVPRSGSAFGAPFFLIVPACP